MNFRDSQSPVVIPPLEVKLKSVTYIYTASGLTTKDGHKFDGNVAQFLPLLKPLKTKTGQVKVHQPKIEKKPVKYWRAQCAFRNLLHTGSITDLQQRLRKARGVGMDVELVNAEKNLKEEFKTKNAQALEKVWDGLDTDEQKANHDVHRFLRERFPIKHQKKTGSGSANDVVVLKMCNSYTRLEIHKGAPTLGLCHESVNAPLGDDGIAPKVDRWIVIGRNTSAVNKEVQKVSREAARIRQRAQDALEERKRKLRETVVSNVKNSRSLESDSSNAKTSKKSAKQGDLWDVAGQWAISCPYVEEQWGEDHDFIFSRARSCSLNIRFTGSSRRGMQMWAKFDFIAITGVFRFEKPSTTSVSDRKSKSNDSDSNRKSKSHVSVSKRKLKSNVVNLTGVEIDDYNYGSSSNDDVSEDGEDSSVSQTPEQFILGIDDKPSPSCPKWNYRWRGEETGEGEIELYADEVLCSITFTGTGGTELTGTFESSLTGKIKFTGHKTGPSGQSCSEDPDDEWHSRNESSYESARVGRWGG